MLRVLRALHAIHTHRTPKSLDCSIGQSLPTFEHLLIRQHPGAQVNMPPGAHDVYGEEHLVSTLAQLMCQHLDVPRWVFKLDNEFGGRGNAHFDVSTMPYYTELLREHDRDPVKWEEAETQARLQQRLVVELMKTLPERVVINTRWLWKSWRDFVAAFKVVGGVIEASPLEIRASPSANLFIEPDGTLSLTSTHEQVPLSACHLPLATRHLPLATCHLPLATCHIYTIYTIYTIAADILVELHFRRRGVPADVRAFPRVA